MSKVELEKLTNDGLVALAYSEAHRSDNPCAEHASLINELIVRLQGAQGRILRWESAASLAAATPEELQEFISNCI